MKNNKFKVATVTLGALAAMLVAMPAAAREYKAKSDVNVKVEKAGIIIPPITPPIIDPPEKPETDWDFALLFVPSKYIFNDLNVPSKLATTESTIALKPTNPVPALEEDPNDPIKHWGMVDARGKKKDGWKLTAELSALTSGTKELTGAKIKSTQVLKEIIDPNLGIKAGGLGAVVSTANAPTVKASLVFSQTAEQVATAAKETAAGASDGKGEGYWAGEMTGSSLTVPADTMNKLLVGENYIGTVDWVLTGSAI